jgi:hypothetical protein
MTGFLDLPPELRLIVYANILETIKARDLDVFWTSDGLEVDLSMDSCIAIPKRMGKYRRRTMEPPKNKRRQNPSVSHRCITPLLSLAQTCKMLRHEVSEFAWYHSDLRAPGTLNEIRSLLASRLILSTMPIRKSSITDLKLTVSDLWEPDGRKAMKEIVRLLNTRLPELTVLELSVPHITSSPRGVRSIAGPSAKPIFAQLHRLRYVLVLFQVYDQNRGCVRDYPQIDGRYPTCRELADLLTDTHASYSDKALDRFGGKHDRKFVHLDYFLETANLRSIAHHGECS